LKRPPFDIDSYTLASAARNAAVDSGERLSEIPTRTLAALLESIDVLLMYIAWLEGDQGEEKNQNH